MWGQSVVKGKQPVAYKQQKEVQNEIKSPRQLWWIQCHLKYFKLEPF